jgi:hypothetical protein
MKIHMRPPPAPLAPTPPPKRPSTALHLEMQAEELARLGQQQQARRRKLYGGRKNQANTDEDTDSEEKEGNQRSMRNLDFLA